MDLRDSHVVELRHPCPLELLELRAAHGPLQILDWLREAEIADAQCAVARAELSQAADHRQLARHLERVIREPYHP